MVQSHIQQRSADHQFKIERLLPDQNRPFRPTMSPTASPTTDPTASPTMDPTANRAACPTVP